MVFKVDINETSSIHNILINYVLTIQRRDKIEEYDNLLHPW